METDKYIEAIKKHRFNLTEQEITKEIKNIILKMLFKKQEKFLFQKMLFTK